MRTTLLLALSALMLTGCGLVRPVNDTEVTVADKALLIHRAANEGTYIALAKVYEDDVADRVMSAAKLKAAIDEYALPLLNNPETQITLVLEDELFQIVPEEYHGLMAAAYETLHTYYNFPATSEVLPEPYLTYLKAFFSGVREGATRTIAASGAIEGRTFAIPERPEEG